MPAEIKKPSKQNKLAAAMAQNFQNDRRNHRPPAAAVPVDVDQVRNVRWVDVALCDDNPFQPAGRDQNIQGMVELLNKEGQLQPGEARPHPDPELRAQGRFQLSFAHRRKYAVLAGGNAGSQMPNPERYRGKMMLIIREDLSDLEMLNRAVSENNGRLDFTPLQQARLYQQMRELTTKQLKEQGRKFSKGEFAPWREVATLNGYNENKFSDMQRMARLLELPHEMQLQFVPDEENPDKFVLNSRHGRALLMLQEDPEQQEALFDAIVGQQLSGVAAETQAQQRLEPKKPQPKTAEISTPGKSPSDPEPKAENVGGNKTTGAGKPSALGPVEQLESVNMLLSGLSQPIRKVTKQEREAIEQELRQVENNIATLRKALNNS